MLGNRYDRWPPGVENTLFDEEERERFLREALLPYSPEDYTATTFVVVGTIVIADSETRDSALEIVDRALSYGEEAFIFEWPGGPDAPE